MKKIGGCLALMLFSLAALPAGIAEEVTIHSELISPSGGYESLHSTDKTVLAASAGSALVIGATAAPAASAVMDIVSDSRGVLIPLLTTAQRDGIETAEKNNGLLIYNTDARKFQFFDTYYYDPLGTGSDNGWKEVGGGNVYNTKWWEVKDDHAYTKDQGEDTVVNVGIGTDKRKEPPAGLTVKDGAVLFMGDGTAGAGDFVPDGAGAKWIWDPAGPNFRAGHITQGHIAGNRDWDAPLPSGTLSISAGEDNTFVTGGPGSARCAMFGLKNICGSDSIQSLLLGQRNNSGNAYAAILIGSDNEATLPETTDRKSVLIGGHHIATATGYTGIGAGASIYDRLNGSSDGLGNVISYRTAIGFGVNPTMILQTNPGDKAWCGINILKPSDPNFEGLEVGNLGGTGNVYCTGGTAVSCSDIALKKDIRPLENVLGKLSAIHGVGFDWKDSSANDEKKSLPYRRIGLIAQEVEKEFPEFVENFGGTKALDYGRFNVVLIKAVQELKIKNDELKNRLEVLTQTVNVRKA